MWAVKHKSGTVLFVTNCERTANNRREMGWIVKEVKMTSREQFERKIQHDYGDDFLGVNDDGDYINWITYDLWEYWVASREAIEITLPEVYGEKYTPSSITMDGFDFEQYLKDLYAAIELEGVKVKK